MLTKFPTQYSIEWNYFEANHGKGAVDGIGGTIKNTVFRQVLAKQIVIQSPRHFAEYANSILKGVDVDYIENAVSEYEAICRKQSKPVNGTMQVHWVKRNVSEHGLNLKK